MRSVRAFAPDPPQRRFWTASPPFWRAIIDGGSVGAVVDESEAQVSWKGIEAGARLVAADGQEIGRVDEVVGDAQVDIFDGLVVSPPGHHAGHHDKRYVGAERVGRIWPDRVEVDLAPDELANLAAYTEPKNVTWRASQGGGITGRLRSAGKDLFGRRR